VDGRPKLPCAKPWWKFRNLPKFFFLIALFDFCLIMHRAVFAALCRLQRFERLFFLLAESVPLFIAR